MSHVEKCSVAFTDLKALKRACETLGVKFVEGQKTFKAYYPNQKCEHAITGIPGTHYEVGIQAVADAKVPTWTATADFFANEGRAIKAALGTDQAAGTRDAAGAITHNLHKLANEYSLEVLKTKARAKGYLFRTVKDGNKTKLVVTLGN